MATHKPNLKRQLKRDQPKKDANPEDFLEIDNLQEQYGKAESFINANTGLVTAAVIGLIALMAAYFWYSRVYIPGQESQASEQMFTAQQNFANDAFQVALDGDGDSAGFLEIIDSYSGSTKANNLAHYYAGISYLNLGQFENAIEFLGKFSGGDAVLGGMAQGAMGDAYMELGDTDNGIKHYRNAANASNNDFTGPMWLMRAGQAMSKQGDHAGAKGMFEAIKEKYPKSQEAVNAIKYIERAAASM